MLAKGSSLTSFEKVTGWNIQPDDSGRKNQPDNSRREIQPDDSARKNQRDDSDRKIQPDDSARKIQRDEGIRIRRIDIPHEKRPAVNKDKLQKPDIEKVIREVKRGRSVAEISLKLGMDPELAEQICRLYLTHPGVTADGIMTKMGL